MPSLNDVVVVGAGLAGLTAARTLTSAGRHITVVEARSFVGGRTMTVKPDGLAEGAWFDVGATWHWEDQPLIGALAAEMGMTAFSQHRLGLAVVDEDSSAVPRRVEMPLPDPAELRFVGGAQGLCERLARGQEVLLDTTVVAIEHDGGTVTVNVSGAEGASRDLTVDAVVVAIPPRLALENIAFTPDLPDELSEVMRRTPTWMATALKAVAVYESAFWREEGLSGLAFSSGGPLREVHDACTADGSAAALWTFVSYDHAYRDLAFDDRLEVVFGHLGRLFGPTAADPLRYFERDWSGDPLTNDEVFAMPRDLLPFGDAAFAVPQWDGRLAWAGTETDRDGGGHMEGAVASGLRAARSVLAVE